MSKIQVTINVDDDAILAESGQSGLEDAIRQELGWLHDSGMFVESWSFLEEEREQHTSGTPDLTEERTKRAAPLWDHSRAFQLPDGSSISVLLKQGSVGRDETDTRKWCAVDIVRESPDHPDDPEPLAVVDYEDDLGLRALVYSPDSEDPIFTKHYGEAVSSLHPFYYTFGTSEAFPFQKGWVEVRAHDRKEADSLFRAQFPDVNPFILNCASVYDAVTFQHVRKETENLPDWNVCHMVLSPDPGDQRAPSLVDRIRNAEGRKNTPAPSTNEKEGPGR